MTQSTFPLGEIITNEHAARMLSAGEIKSGLKRHARGDWGNVPYDLAAANNRAMKYGSRVISAFGKHEKRFWIITEADRSTTTISLPSNH